MSNTTYPTTIDTPTNPSTGSTLATVPHHLQHGLENDAIVALETKLGTGTLLQTPTTNGFLVGTGSGASQWQPSPTSPSFTTSILDTNGKTWIGQTAVTNAVNYLNIANAATTGTPILSSLGSDNNINLNLVPKGSGKVQDNGTNLIDFRTSFGNFVQAGGAIWSLAGGLNGNMTAAIIFINGVEYIVGSVTGHAFAANVDTYIDYTAGTGIVYTAVANNAASPALAANSVRIGIAVSGASLTSFNQGSPAATTPVASSIIYSITDSLGNLIYPTSPEPQLLGYRQITASFTSTTSTSPQQIIGLSCSVLFPGGNRKYRVMVSAAGMSVSTISNAVVGIWDGVVNSGTQIGKTTCVSPTANFDFPCIAMAYIMPPAGLKTFNASANNTLTGTCLFEAAATFPAFISVEEVS